MRRYLAVGSTALLLVHCNAVTPVAPAPEEEVFHGLPCGKPLPERCGPVGRIYLALPSRVGLPPRQPRPEPPPPAPKRPSRSHSPGSVIELDEVEPQVAVANDGEVYSGETPRIGTMSEGAAQAKRLFDKGAWAEAAVALERAATGQYGDDEGNRQLAEYHLAVAHFNLKHYETAADLFLLIMEDPGHHKIGDSWNWLPRLLGRCTTRSVLMGLRRFDDSGTLYCFTSDDGRRAHRWQVFLRARAFAEAREFDEAWTALNEFLGDPEYGEAADQCLDWIETQSPFETP